MDYERHPSDVSKATNCVEALFHRHKDAPKSIYTPNRRFARIPKKKSKHQSLKGFSLDVQYKLNNAAQLLHKGPASEILRYFVPQIPITGKTLNGYLMFSVKNIVQNIKLIELWGNNFVPLHFVFSKSSFL